MVQTVLDQELPPNTQIVNTIRQIGLAQTPQTLLEAIKDIAPIQNAVQVTLTRFNPEKNKLDQIAKLVNTYNIKLNVVNEEAIYTRNTAPILWQIDPTTPLVIEDINISSDVDSLTRDTLTTQGIKSLVAVGLTAGFEHLGWLFIQNAQSQTYLSSEITYLQILANPISLNLHNQFLRKQDLDNGSKPKVESPPHNLKLIAALEPTKSIGEFLEIIVNFKLGNTTTLSLAYLAEDFGSEHYQCSTELQIPPSFYLEITNILPDTEAPPFIINDITTSPDWSACFQKITTLSPQSLLVIPCDIDYGRATGFILFIHNDRDIFPESILDFAQQLRHHVITTLGNIFFNEDAQASLKEAQILLDASRELFATAQLKDIYKTMAQAFVATGANKCTMVVFNKLDENNFPQEREIAAVKSNKIGDISEIPSTEDIINLIDDNIYPYLSKFFHQRESITIGNITESTDLNANEKELLDQTQAIAIGIIPFFSIATSKGLGFAFLEYDKPHVFAARELAFFRTIANQTIISIENAQRLTTTQQRAKQVQTGAEISKITSSILDQKSLIEKSVSLIKEGFSYYYVGLFLINEDGEWAILEAGTGKEGQAQVDAGHKLAVNEKSMIGWSVLNKEARIALDIGQDAVHFNNPFLPLTRSEMALPLISRDLVIGALTIQSSQPMAFSNDDVVTLQIMADQLANALVNSRLYQSLQQTAQKMSLLLEINSEISASVNLDDLLNLITVHATKIVGGDQGTTFLLKNNLLIPQAVAGKHKEDMLKIQVRLGQGICGKAATNKESISQIITTPTDDLPAVMWEKTTFPQSIIAIPIETDVEMIGVLLIQRINKPDGFVESEINLLEGMALQAAIAVKNVNLLTETQAAQQQTENLYQLSRHLSSVKTIKGAADTIINHLPKEELDRIIIALKEDIDNLNNPWVENVVAWQRNSRIEKFTGARFPETYFLATDGNSQEDFISISDFDDNPRLNQEGRHFFSETLGLKSVLIIPINISQKILGWLLCGSIYQRTVFTPGQITILQAIVDLLAGTVDRMQKSISLKDAGQQYSTMVNNIPGAVYRAKTMNRQTILYISDELYQITGYPPESFTEGGSLSLEDIIYPDDREKVKTTLESLLNQQEPYELQYRIVHKYGQIKHISERGVGIFDEYNNLLHLDGVIFDVTDQVSLEKAVQHRAAQFEAIAQIGQRASAILDVDRLLAETVDLICKTFNFYYAGLFLLDSNNEWAILRAGYGEAGQKMLAKQHRLKRDTNSMVGWATYHGEPHLALDVGKEKHRFDNPNLPLTRSEIALPLISQSKVIGALDVQSVEENAFSEDDIATLQLMANQLANVIQNARLFETTQRSLTQANLLHRITESLLAVHTEDELFKLFVGVVGQTDIDTVSIQIFGKLTEERYLETREVWSRNRKTWTKKGTRFTASNAVLFDLISPHQTVFIKDVQTNEQLKASPERANFDENTYQLVILPLIIQNVTPGFVIVESNNPDHIFDEDDIRFFESLAQQLSITWQNLRLVSSIENRLRRERVIRELTGKVHAAVGIENILKTTVTELTKALDTPGGIARLGNSQTGKNPPVE